MIGRWIDRWIDEQIDDRQIGKCRSIDIEMYSKIPGKMNSKMSRVINFWGGGMEVRELRMMNIGDNEQLEGNFDFVIFPLFFFYRDNTFSYN